MSRLPDLIVSSCITGSIFIPNSFSEIRHPWTNSRPPSGKSVKPQIQGICTLAQCPKNSPLLSSGEKRGETASRRNGFAAKRLRGETASRQNVLAAKCRGPYSSSSAVLYRRLQGYNVTPTVLVN
ncbi:hypothetical protein L596_020555 [Steinernema carpocapsae]|uniref:Uncharacterized protein n=1 Tax=Steinernema carpocapsae TaxID=34508 RepID=A0A4U5MTW5_STECR|nr:hypothetical protein L596_020555 [Steinernema carpocapsae]